MDDRPNRRQKAAYSNFSGVVWALLNMRFRGPKQVKAVVPVCYRRYELRMGRGLQQGHWSRESPSQ